MDYKEKYEQALKTAKLLADNTDDEICKKKIEAIFPELIESEDEIIRKELIEFVDINTLSTDERHDRWIAWLEKQGIPAKLSEEERNRFAKGVLSECAISFINYLDSNKRKGKMCVSNGECEDIENAFHNCMWDKLHGYYRKYIDKDKQKSSTWSEEDEKMLDIITDYFEWGIDYFFDENDCNKAQDWLKSLKERIE